MTTHYDPARLALLESIRDALIAVMNREQKERGEIPRLSAEIVDRYAGHWDVKEMEW